jgi:long-chain acyl-CoA synthetase
MDIALVDDEVALTRAASSNALERVAAALLAQSPDPADRVGVVGDNRAETLLAHAGGLVAGVGTVALAKGLSAAELRAQIADASITAIITGPRSLEAVRTAARASGLCRVIATGEQPGAGEMDPVLVGWNEWLAAAPAGVGPDRRANPPIVYTSGTTGRPRGSHVRWATLEGSSGEYLERLRAGFHGPWGAHLVVGPLQHNGPLTAVRNFLSGCPVIVLGHFDAEQTLALIERYRVESTVMVPTHFQRLLALGPDVRARYDVSSLVQVNHTGSACPPDVKRQMIEWFGPTLVESYGATECGTVTRISSAEWLRHPQSVGRAVPPFRVVAVNDSGADLPAGETGVLAVVAPPDRRIVYHDDPEKTARAYVRPDAFTLGDVGRVDDEGFVFITDRLADMVVSGGVNLYPAESENALIQHPDVAEVAVIGVPHEDLGEQLLALVVPANPTAPPAAADLDRYCREHIAAFKCPKDYRFVDILIRNEMNKLDKRAMRKPYWDGDRTIAG